MLLVRFFLSVLTLVSVFPQSTMAENTLGFTAEARTDILASPEKVFSVLNATEKWMKHEVSREHIGGPENGVGARHSVVTQPDGHPKLSREEEIISFQDNKRITRYAFTSAPYKTGTFIDMEITPKTNDISELRLTIYLQMASSVMGGSHSDTARAALPGIIKHNETILQGHVSRIKAVSEAE